MNSPLLSVGLVVLISVFFNSAISVKIHYVDSSVWTLRPVSSEQVTFIENLERSNTGIFVWHLEANEDLAVLPVPAEAVTSFSRFQLVAPPITEQETLQKLRAQGIAYEEFQDLSPQNRLVDTRKFVLSRGKLPLNIKVRNFKYEIPSEQTLESLYEPMDLIDKITVPNNSPATVIISLSESQTMTQSWELSFTKTLTGVLGGDLNINLPNVGGGGLSASVTLEFSSTQSISQSIERSYGIARQVAIPPYTTIQAHGYVNWLNDIEIPFEATGEVYLDTTGNNTEIKDVGLIYCQDGTQSTICYRTCGRTYCPAGCVQNSTCECCYFAVTQENAGIPNVMRDYLIAQGDQVEVIGTSGKYLLLRLRGTFTASLGTDLVFNVTEITDSKVIKQVELLPLPVNIR